MNRLRYLPAMHQLKKHPYFSSIKNTYQLSDEVLTEWLSEQVAEIRTKIINGDIKQELIHKEKLTKLIFDLLTKEITTLYSKENLQSVVNATGVVLHTNLGRARLSKQAIKQITNVAAMYSTLEYNTETGERGSRHDIVEKYINQITGSEAAIIVNNNAAAVFLVLKALASSKEVIISRGELVEIGGSFRISSIMEETNANLVSVGTTNKTYISDYEQAITENTALLMKVHKSNFKMIGFTMEVDTNELVKLSNNHNIPVYEDLGSGTLFNFKNKHIGNEPTVQEKIKAGIDIISFSGDKLLGGPQAGIIVGKKMYIDQLKTHQLARVLRVDKFTLAGLEATLKSYIKGKEQEEIPTIRSILEPSQKVLEKANRFVERISKFSQAFTCNIERDKSKVGGGTMPEVEINTYVVKVMHRNYSTTELATRLRNHRVPIIVRVKKEAVVLDFRTVNEEELEIVIEALLNIPEKKDT